MDAVGHRLDILRDTFGSNGPDATEGTIAPGAGCPFNFFTSRKWNYTDAGLTLRDHTVQTRRNLCPRTPTTLKARPAQARKSRYRTEVQPFQPSVNFGGTLQRFFQLLETEVLASRDFQDRRLAAAAQLGGIGNLSGKICRNHDRTVLVGMNEVIRAHRHAGDADFTTKVLGVDPGM